MLPMAAVPAPWAGWGHTVSTVSVRVRGGGTEASTSISHREGLALDPEKEAEFGGLGGCVGAVSWGAPKNPSVPLLHSLPCWALWCCLPPEVFLSEQWQL